MSPKRIALLCALTLAIAIPAFATPPAIPKLQGKVLEVRGDEVRLSIEGDELPQPGDEVTLGFRIPGGPLINHGTWRVTRVERGDAFATRVQATGTPAPGHEATILSPRPVRRQASAEPLQAPAGATEIPQHNSQWLVRFEGREYRTRYEAGTHEGAPIDLYYYRTEPVPGAATDPTPWGRFVRVPSVRQPNAPPAEWWHSTRVWRDGQWTNDARRGVAVELRRAD